MAKLQAALIVTQVPAGASESSGGSPPPPNTVTGAKRLSIHRSLGVSEQMSYAATGPDAIFLNPGQQPGGCQIVAFSLDGGAGIDARMLSTGAAIMYDQVPYVQESGSSIAVAMANARIRRWTAQQIKLLDLIRGAPNGIFSKNGQQMLTGGILPDMQGLMFTVIGLQGGQQAAALTFDFIVDPSVQDLYLDIDINRNYLLPALDQVVERLATTTDPQRAQYAIDSGDLGDTPQSVTIGHLDEASRLTFDATSTTYAPPAFLRGGQAQAQTADMAASVCFLGGTTSHGMPDNGTITAMVTLNHAASDATGNYRSGMPVISVYVNRDQGGVYYWPGDGSMHPLTPSQSFGVTGLWYDETASELLAATDLGVYTHPSDPGDSHAWTRLGGMALKVAKVIRTGNVTYALVAFQTDGSTHILSYPGSSTGNGYDGWDLVSSQASITDFSVGGGLLYYTTTGSGTETQVFVHTIGSSASESSLTIPGGAVASGLDCITTGDLGALITGTFLRTSAGAAGLYYIAAGSKSLINANPDNTLVDEFHQPVKVNRITQHGAGTIEWSTGSAPVLLWAATNRGVYASPAATGGQWKPTSGQSTMADVDIACVASAPGRAWLGRTETRVYAITNSSLWVSYNGTVHWIDALSLPLDGGPAFFAMWKDGVDGQGGHGVYPDNVATTIKFPNADGPYELVRELDESTGGYVYTLYNQVSLAPAGAHRDAQISEISTPALMSEVTSSTVLIAEMARFLGFTASGQMVVEVASKFSDDADPLRFLRETQRVTVNAVVEMCLTSTGVVTFVDLSGMALYVLEHDIDYDADADPVAAHTLTRCVAFLRKDPTTDPNKIAGDGWYATSRLALYASHKGR